MVRLRKSMLVLGMAMSSEEFFRLSEEKKFLAQYFFRVVRLALSKRK